MKRILLTAMVVLEAFAANAKQEWLDVIIRWRMQSISTRLMIPIRQLLA